MTSFRKTLVAAATAIASLTAAVPALADITVGISLPLTGPASGLGIPMANFFKLFPATIAGEKLNVIILDDATDPTKGVQNAKRFVTEDKVDIIIGSAATPVAGPMAAVAAESGTVQLAASPVGLPPGGDGRSGRGWSDSPAGWPPGRPGCPTAAGNQIRAIGVDAAGNAISTLTFTLP